ncbi:MAG: DUF4358 domain-containing protein [Eubacterium sp.]|nr:DUF4358 domain-containing protein [Eubacterium sp.]
MRKKTGSIISLIIILATTAIMLCPAAMSVAKGVKTSKVYTRIMEAYGDEFPLSEGNLLNIKRTNIFGDYSMVLGVSSEYFSEYKAAKKSNSKEEYICFVCKATKKENIKKIKNGMKSFILNEARGNANYFSTTGKELLKNTKIGSKGKYVYLFVIDTNKNKKAVEAFKDALG